MLEQIKGILLNYIESKEITKDSILNADLGLSSFDVVSIITDFEEKFHIEIPDRDIGKFVSVRDILEYMEAHT